MSSLFGIGGGGNVGASGSFYPYSIDQSLRFNDGDSAYLSRTFASAGNQKTWTWSGWVKRGNLTNGALFSANSSSNQIIFESDRLYFEHNGGGNYYLISSNKLRDPNAWYHLVFVWDTSNVTSTDRMRIYINGERVTNFDSSSYPTLNLNSEFNKAITHEIGHRINPSLYYFDGYMAEVNFIDGTALDPTSFGETINGVWVPKAYSGSYGTNGFYLPFDDSSAIGDDESGNTNDWTANNLAASDVVLDSPTNNFATWNPLVKTGQTITFKEGNLNIAASSAFWSESNNFNQSTIGVLGGSNAKHYFEFTMENNTSGSYVIGVGRHNSKAIDSTHYTGGVVYYYNRCSSDSTNTVTSLSIAASLTIIRLAFDASNGKVWIGDNNGYFNSGDPANGTGEVGTISGYDGETLVAILNRSTNSGNQIVNFGQDSTFANRKTSGSANAADDNGIGDFYYAPPSGFLALCTANLPEPAIGPNSTEQADDYFATVLYTGDGTSSNAITVGFQPDWTWIKQRDGTPSHALFDSVRGADNVLRTNGTEEENNSGISTATFGGLTSFDSNGFTVDDGTSTTFDATNGSGDSYVAWSWKAGGTAVSNTDGSITSSVSAAPDAGFSVVTYTGAGGVSTIGHGLSQPLDVFIVKNRSATSDWEMFHSALGNTARIELQSTAAQVTGVNGWNSTSPTDTVFTVNGGGAGNTSGNNHLAYCFHSVPGYSKFSSFVGNGSADGVFVALNFRPAWILWKKSSATAGWFLMDSARDTSNVANTFLRPNASDAEGTAANSTADFLSNGFKLRGTGGDVNTNGATYIYLAFAEAPFKYANAR